MKKTSKRRNFNALAWMAVALLAVFCLINVLGFVIAERNNNQEQQLVNRQDGTNDEANNEVSDDTNDEPTTIEPEISATNSPLESFSDQPTALPDEITVKDLVDDYQSGRSELSEYYEVRTEEDCIYLELCDGRRVAPGMIIPYAEWTPENILEHYLSAALGTAETNEWGRVWNRNLDCYALTAWSEDYEHQLQVAYGVRIYMDGEFSGFLPFRTTSGDPEEVLRMYQSGGWDGSVEPLYTEDYSTYIKIYGGSYSYTAEPSRGKLCYSYINYPLDSRRTGHEYLYDATPWWRNSELEYEIDPIAFDTEYDKEANEIIHQYEKIYLPIYPDLPDGNLQDSDGYGEVMKVSYCDENGTLVFTTEGIWLFKCGKLIQGWPGLDIAELEELGYTE